MKAAGLGHAPPLRAQEAEAKTDPPDGQQGLGPGALTPVPTRGFQIPMSGALGSSQRRLGGCPREIATSRGRPGPQRSGLLCVPLDFFHLCILWVRLMSDFVSRARAGTKKYPLMGKIWNSQPCILQQINPPNIFYHIPFFLKLSQAGVTTTWTYEVSPVPPDLFSQERRGSGCLQPCASLQAPHAWLFPVCAHITPY